MDLAALERVLVGEAGTVPLVMTHGHQQLRGRTAGVLENIRARAALCRAHGVPFFIDACRFAENAWFIKTREPGYADKLAAGYRTGDVRAGRRLHDEREKGRHGEYRRIPRA